MVEQLAGYFTDFGETVTFGAATFTAIIDVPTLDYDVALSAPLQLTAIAADIGALAKGSSITVRSVAYTVRQVQPDGTGLVTITATTP
jgi:hypothetical protein